MIFSVPLAAAIAICSMAVPQSTFVEIEPNGTKVEATLVSCMRSGDMITGLTTGSSGSAGDVTTSSADTFLVRTCALPIGIYRHELVITTSGAPEHSGSIRGLNQTGLPGFGGQIGTQDVAVQSTSTSTAPPRLSAWYGFGKQEQVYYRVIGTSNTTAPYTATLATHAIVPGVVPGSFQPGVLTITTAGQGHNTDTDLWIYDANFNAIPTYGNDDWFNGTTFQSTLVRPFAPGTYYLAISNFNLCNNQPSPSDDNYVMGSVLDFPDVACDSQSNSASVDLSFAVSDGQTTVPVAASRSSPYEISWWRFEVGISGPQVSSYCFGDGTSAACPCGNYGSFGNGCASSINANGANLGAGGIPSVAADTFMLIGSGMPDSFAFYYQGTTAFISQFGDGLRCVTGSILRVSTKMNTGGGSQYPALGEPAVSVVGLVHAGDLRNYQVWYRNSDPTFCTPSTFNLTNGVHATWLP